MRGGMVFAAMLAMFSAGFAEKLFEERLFYDQTKACF
jgi:hypothetical protein